MVRVAVYRGQLRLSHGHPDCRTADRERWRAVHGADCVLWRMLWAGADMFCMGEGDGGGLGGEEDLLRGSPVSVEKVY